MYKTIIAGKHITMNPTFYKITVCQIITLFGNAALRFALPLYLLRRTDSAALFQILLFTAIQAHAPTGQTGRFMSSFLLALSVCLTHETLDRIYCVLRVCDGLTLSKLLRYS